ncbi:hypothetical protein Plav_0765 [Parvibaculum lavamentivorans DS-1]|uniref:Uncharacterized protein n=1 Tax=Parvibaculum lavamentivorans (strain DS-1 / DSM 13023 / NCIMB 13966) TaxID=402881 RepID=A7HR55_PARL1|nr:hypothetical protein [Parvibaculum lavamentivorans]ABS62388.1 hypothetical protein Plav_0765 [Parvibaculum lavamentivorans DS-1]
MTPRTVFTLALVFSAGLCSAAAAVEPLTGTGKFDTGSRSGPFVATDKSLTTLAGDGYEIRGNLGTALILQKGPSIYSCQIPPDPEALDFKPYFVCAELQEEAREAMAQKEPGTTSFPRKGN